jgi:hypothetical protein
MDEKLLELLNTRVRQRWNYRINFDRITHGNENLMNQWCEKNCEGSWNSETKFSLYWQFDSERDAMMFKLRWGTANGNQLR